MNTDLSSLLSNVWFISIASSIISGFIVYFFTSRVFSTKQNKEYFQKVNAANNEILYIIRPLIVDKNIPDFDALSSLINSTSIKYQVNIKDLYTRERLEDDIIREVLGNPFLNSTAKTEYCRTVKSLLGFKVKKDEEITSEIREGTSITRRNSNSTRLMSMMMAAFSSILMILFSNEFILKEKSLSEDNVKILFLITGLMIIVLLLSLILSNSDRFVKILRFFIFESDSEVKDKKDKKESE